MNPEYTNDGSVERVRGFEQAGRDQDRFGCNQVCATREVQEEMPALITDEDSRRSAPGR